jgi:hypothetical protein
MNEAALDSCAVIIDPYEPDVRFSSLRRRFGYFMHGLAAATDLKRTVDFNALKFCSQHAVPLLRDFYDFYGAQDSAGLRETVTGPLLAKLKGQVTITSAVGKKGKSRKDEVRLLECWWWSWGWYRFGWEARKPAY